MRHTTKIRAFRYSLIGWLSGGITGAARLVWPAKAIQEHDLCTNPSTAKVTRLRIDEVKSSNHQPSSRTLLIFVAFRGPP